MTDVERWLPVVGFEGSYEVSDHGRVRGLDRIGAAGQRVAGRVLTPTPNSHGYPAVTLYGNGLRRVGKVHRLVLEAFVGPCPDGMEACHGPDRDQTNNRLSNLRWGTSSENNFDRVRHGTHPRARWTHCPRRHPLAAPNLIPASVRRGYRNCLACDRARKHLRRRPDAGDLQTISDQKFAQIIAAAESAA